VLAALSQGLEQASRDSDAGFACALCLVDSPQPEQAARARRVLYDLGRSWLFKGPAPLWQPPPGRACVILMVPLPVPPVALEALLSFSERGPHRIMEALLPLIQSRPFTGWSEQAQARWGTWARAVLRELPGFDALGVLHWVGAPPVTPQAVRAFVEAVAVALEREPARQRAALMNNKGFSGFLSLAGSSEEPLLNRWARDAECARPLVKAILGLTSSFQQAWPPPQGQPARLLIAVWEGPGRQPLLEALAQEARHVRSGPGKEELIDAVSQRFQQHQDERAELLTAFAVWRDTLRERHRAATEDAEVPRRVSKNR
jgi:hypothetical protein